jgi:hypothetical protein
MSYHSQRICGILSIEMGVFWEQDSLHWPFHTDMERGQDTTRLAATPVLGQCVITICNAFTEECRAVGLRRFFLLWQYSKLEQWHMMHTRGKSGMVSIA